MLKNFFKTAIRNLLKHKVYAVINFIGLTCGLTLSLLIITYVRSEINYDRFHEHIDRLYRLSYTVPNGLQLALTPPPIAPRMAEFFPEVETAGRLFGRSVTISKPNEKESFEETDVFFADSSLTRMMTFDFVKGNPARALREPFTVILNEEMAKKYFDNKDPLGETLILSGSHPFTVTGVVKDFPEDSHIKFNMLIPYDNMFDLENDRGKQMRERLAINFIISHSYTYVLLKPGADPASVDKKMGDFLKKYAKPELIIGQIFTLFPVKDIHLLSELQAEPTATTSLATLYIFIAVGVMTLLIACINYINLSTAQSFSRIKEIGIRKILGSMKYQLIIQFIAESFLFCLIAFLLAFGVFNSLLPVLNFLTDKHFIFIEVVDRYLIIFSLLLLIVMTLLAGGYPAYFVTKFESVHSLKGNAAGFGNQFLRRTLVVFQLSIACLLLSGSLMIMKQMNFLNARPLGFQREHIVTIPLFSDNFNGVFGQGDSLFQSRLQTYRAMVEAQSTVKGTALSSNAPGLGVIYRMTIPDGFTQQDNMFAANLAIDHDFIETYQMEIIAGRAFSKEFPSDVTEGFIVNETAVKEFNWESPERAIGKLMNVEGKKGKVIGVIRDFNFTVTSPVSALVLELNPVKFTTLSVKFENQDVQSVISQLEDSWSTLFPEKAFEFHFLDDQLTEQYESYQNFGFIIQGFTLVAILISCLGVYGLVLFMVQRKVKEIGVRKVLGATAAGIVKNIYVDFGILIIIGFAVATPFSYYLITKWLEDFTYHTSVDVFTYLISFILIATIVGLTISYHAMKASLANPVLSLRSE